MLTKESTGLVCPAPSNIIDRVPPTTEDQHGNVEALHEGQAVCMSLHIKFMIDLPSCIYS